MFSEFKRNLRFVMLMAGLLAIAIIGVETFRRMGMTQPTGPVTAPSSASGASAVFPRELNDGSGYSVRIEKKPLRIISQTLATDEILLAICDPRRIVALSSLAEDPTYSNVATEAKQVTGRTTQGVEQILEMGPDLIFVASYSRTEFVELLKAARAPVFRFANFDRIEDIKTNIQTVGYATGDEAAAAALVDQINRDIEAVKARIPQAKPPLKVMSYSLGGFTAGSGTLFDEMLRTVGVINVTAEKGITGIAKISPEKLTEWQPDVIVVGADAGTFDEARRKLLADPAVASTKAGKANRIIVVDNRHYLAVSHHLVKALNTLVTELYGR